MSINIEKINECLKKESLVGALKKDMSDENIKKQFELEGIKFSDDEVKEFKNIISEVRNKIENDGLESVVGGFGVDSAVNNMVKGSASIYGSVKDIGVAAGKIAGGAARNVWGTLQFPVALVYDAGKGIYKGAKKAFED